MNKITELKEFLYLIATEPENVYLDDEQTNLDKTDSLRSLGDCFKVNTYYHKPQIKPRKKALYYVDDSIDTYCFYTEDIPSNYYKIPNTEFEVDEEGKPIEGDRWNT